MSLDDQPGRDPANYSFGTVQPTLAPNVPEAGLARTDEPNAAVEREAPPPPANVVLTYQQCLRAIGRYLDRGRYRYSLICQIPNGFVIRGYPSGFENVRSAEALVFTAEDLTSMIADLMVTRAPLPANVIPDPSQVPRLLPTGYEDFLRALGYECDVANMRNMRLVETLDGVLLSYDLPGSKMRQERGFDEQEIYTLLNAAFSRRGSLPANQGPLPPASPPSSAAKAPSSSVSEQSPLRRIGIKR